MVDIVRLKRDGSVLIPRAVRREMGLTTEGSLVLVSGQDTLLLKPLHQAQLRRQLRNLTQVWHKRFRQANLSVTDAMNEIKAVRVSKK